MEPSFGFHPRQTSVVNNSKKIIILVAVIPREEKSSGKLHKIELFSLDHYHEIK